MAFYQTCFQANKLLPIKIIKKSPFPKLPLPSLTKGLCRIKLRSNKHVTFGNQIINLISF
jgi:hypothetical protein